MVNECPDPDAWASYRRGRDAAIKEFEEILTRDGRKRETREHYFKRIEKFGERTPRKGDYNYPSRANKKLMDARDKAVLDSIMDRMRKVQSERLANIGRQDNTAGSDGEPQTCD